MILPLRETSFLMMFMIFFATSFGIDCWWVLASILAPFWNPFGIKFHVFGWLIFWWFFKLIFHGKWSPKWMILKRGGGSHFLSFFASFFYTLVPFTNVRPTSPRNNIFQLSSKTSKNVSTLVPFTSVRPTSAPWLFLPFWRKNNVKNLNLKQFLHRLAPFWSPFGFIWVVLVLFWLHFELFMVPFRSLWLAFSSQISEKLFGTLSAKHPEKTSGTMTFASNRLYGPGAEPCHRQIRSALGPKAPRAC